MVGDNYFSGITLLATQPRQQDDETAHQGDGQPDANHHAQRVLGDVGDGVPAIAVGTLFDHRDGADARTAKRPSFRRAPLNGSYQDGRENTSISCLYGFCVYIFFQYVLYCFRVRPS